MIPSSRCLLATLLATLFAAPTIATVHVNEVADKGTTGQCNGGDWVEIYNDDLVAPVAMEGYVMHDDKGPADKPYTFAANTTLAAGGFLVVCYDKLGVNGMKFKVGGDDTVSLLNAAKVLVSSSGRLADDGNVLKTWSRKADNTYAYSFTPTPGAANVITTAQPVAGDDPALTAQNKEGEWFFGMDGNGVKVPGSEDVVELHATMLPADLDYMAKNQSYEVYSAVQSFKVVTKTNGTTTLTAPGRIRPRGQSTLAFGTCLGLSIPYKLDFASTDIAQTLFGVSQGCAGEKRRGERGTHTVWWCVLCGVYCVLCTVVHVVLHG